jgi:hypothetical protein
MHRSSASTVTSNVTSSPTRGLAPMAPSPDGAAACETRSLFGRAWPMKRLPATTPILCQWFVRDSSAYGTDEVPILNTPTAYLDILKNNCAMGKGRCVVLLMDGDLTTGQHAALKTLEQDMGNLHIVHRDQVNWKSCDWAPNEARRQSIDPASSESMLEQIRGDNTMFWIDTYRLLALLKGPAALLSDADLPSPLITGADCGCIYLDMDMQITSALGEIALPDGIGAYCRTDTSYDRRPYIENGIMAVDQPGHPVLRDALDELQRETVPYAYGAWINAIRRHFGASDSARDEWAQTAQFVAFPIEHLNPDLGHCSWG